MKSHDQSHVDRWMERQTPTDISVELSVVVPSYNEQWRLPSTLIDMIDYFDAQSMSYEIIVVDDGSPDHTSDVVRKFEKIRSPIKLITVPRNYGKGHAVRTGVLNARGDRILFADADGATPIREMERLEKALDNGADVAIGSRAMHSADTAVVTKWYRKYLGRVFNFCVNILLIPEIRDTQCGFKMFTSDAARFLFERQTSDNFSFDVEILYIAKRASMKVEEVPINWTNVPGSKVNLVIDALAMIRDVFVFRFRHRAVTPGMFTRRTSS